MQPESERTCIVIRHDEQYQGKQGLKYERGISAESAGSKGLCMHLLTIPPGGRAKAHLHERHESAIYVLSGKAGMWYGDGLRHHVWVAAGDYLYIPANVPHLPYNASQIEPCIAIAARTDANEQESVTLLSIPDPGAAE